MGHNQLLLPGPCRLSAMGPAPPQHDAIDTMHYESRMLRDELKAANMRVLRAKSRLPADLSLPQQGSLMVQDWQPPAVPLDFDSVSNAHHHPRAPHQHTTKH